MSAGAYVQARTRGQHDRGRGTEAPCLLSAWQAIAQCTRLCTWAVVQLHFCDEQHRQVRIGTPSRSSKLASQMIRAVHSFHDGGCDMQAGSKTRLQLTSLLSAVQTSLAELKVEVASARKLTHDAVPVTSHSPRCGLRVCRAAASAVYRRCCVPHARHLRIHFCECALLDTS